ncbi:MAG: sigma-70 family RNA polymerase sigma factor [Planctomycetaceae bacterium]|nr:sigma-70 family RNA polymerase sigma factor [Planctomycetaceae bacterium]
MSSSTGQTSSAGAVNHSGARFAATRWSIVLAARGDGSASATRRAMEELAGAYWFPLYAFARRKGEGPAAAEDLVQEFFARLLEKDFLAQVDRSKGKFRSFLLAAMQHFMANQRAMQRAMKRGGPRGPIALDGLDAEGRYALEPADELTPERLFDRRWALTVLDQVLRRLGEEYAAAGKGELYAAISGFLTADRERADYSTAARQLGWAEGTVRVAVHRLRRRYRDLLRVEIAQTVDSPEQVEEEISHLLNCL